MYICIYVSLTFNIAKFVSIKGKLKTNFLCHVQKCQHIYQKQDICFFTSYISVSSKPLITDIYIYAYNFYIYKYIYKSKLLSTCKLNFMYRNK